MRPAAQRAGAFLAGLGAALLVAAAYAALAWTSVAAQLERDAQAREAVWRTPLHSPWHWRFARRDAVVWPGSSNFAPAAAPARGVTGRLVDGHADLSLALAGERVDLALVTGALLQSSSDAPLTISLIGHTGSSELLLGSADLRGGARGGHLPLNSDVRRPLDALRLHVEGPDGAEFTLHELLLIVQDGAYPAPCPFDADAARWSEACKERVPRVAGEGFARPEPLLAWRDAALATRPVAIVRASPVIPAWTGPREWLFHWPGWAWWILAAVPLAVAAMGRARPSASRGRALFEATSVFLPAILLLWCGWPERDTPMAVGIVFAATLIAAFALRDSAPRPLAWIGDRAAWQGALGVAAGAVALLVLGALANAFDADGFVRRPVGSDHAWRYPLWALLQQWILMRAIAPRMKLATGSDAAAAIASGALFGLLHLPNLSLMLLTFAAGTAWALLGLRHRALLPLAATHAALGLTLFALVPPWLVRSAEVGGRYLMAP